MHSWKRNVIVEKEGCHRQSFSKLKDATGSPSAKQKIISCSTTQGKKKESCKEREK
jgi:hypothetical protein